jgi:hypothetical protein
VRWGKEGETLKLLNGNTIKIDDKVGVIADDKQVESLAGIMGGDATAVSDDTKNIYIEAAFWFPKAVAGRSRHFNFSTDAGHRFERGVDPSSPPSTSSASPRWCWKSAARPRRKSAPWTTRSPICPPQARATARGACGQGHRHGRDAAAMPGCAERPGPARHRGSEGVISVTRRPSASTSIWKKI